MSKSKFLSLDGYSAVFESKGGRMELEVNDSSDVVEAWFDENETSQLLEFMVIHEGSRLFHWYKNTEDTMVLKHTETSEWCGYVFLDGDELSYMVNSTAAASQGENQMFVHRMCKEKVRELTSERQKQN